MQSQAKAGWTGESPYDRFFDFIAPGADRYGILLERIEGMGIRPVVIPVEGNRHVFIFPQDRRPPDRRMKASAAGVFPFQGQSPVILVAHYDRVAGSPGANDNSAAVFHLLKAARILGRQGEDYWIIIFTDKEELLSGESIMKQGSFGLAEKLRAWGLGGARIFNFDACGSGETFVVSSTADYILGNDRRPGIRRVRQDIRNLREYALKTARLLRLNQVVVAPTPFSDDAGFLRAGLPAQTITMLPFTEASSYLSLLRRRPEFTGLLVARTETGASARRLIPETWRCLNSPADSHARLTPENFSSLVRFAVGLCTGKEPV
jgi:hypothetical protein